ncbi:MAG: hypothetical protein M3O50_14915 [Myxococcota bacterium]|nr:hypothetical protein [Myxococcota bacterium]
MMAVGEIAACNSKDDIGLGALDATAEGGVEAAATSWTAGDSSVSPRADALAPDAAADSANGDAPIDELDISVVAMEASLPETGGDDGAADVEVSWNGDSQLTGDGDEDAVNDAQSAAQDASDDAAQDASDDAAQDALARLSEASAEAGGPDAWSNDGAPGGATEGVVRAARGDACLQCARDNHCLDTGKTCEALAGQTADAGVRVGASREELCLDTLACVLTSYCFETGNGVGVCICGRQGTFQCTTSGPLLDSGGDCVFQEQAGLESSDPSIELHAQRDPLLGGGMANSLALCVRNVPCIACL